MGKKKRGPPLDEILQRPWCYYCEKDFDDLNILLNHQKAKHYKCTNCGRRLNTIGGLKVHMNQVHKEEIHEVDNALPNRKEIVPGLEIFAMEGIPDDVMRAHKQRITEMFFKKEAEHRLKTGNPPPGQVHGGANGEPVPKKRKMETKEEMMSRLAEHRKKRAAEKAAQEAGLPVGSEGENNSNEGTPANGSGSSAPANLMPPVPTTVPAMGQPYAYTPPNTSYPFPQPPVVFTPSAMPPMPPQAYVNSPFSPGPPAWTASGPAPALPYSQEGRTANNESPNLGYRLPLPLTSQHQGSGPPPNAPGTLPGLPSPAPGLPQRPSFQAPHLSKEEMAQMHSGQYNENLHNRHESYQSPLPTMKQEASSPAAAIPTTNVDVPPNCGVYQDQDFQAGLDALISLEQERADKRVSTEMYGGGVLYTSTETLTSSRLPHKHAPPGFSATPAHPTLTFTAASLPVAIPSALAATSLSSTSSSSTNIANSLAGPSVPAIATPSNRVPLRDSSTITAASLTNTGPTSRFPNNREIKKKKHDAHVRLVYSDDAMSPEEKLSIRPKYAYRRPADQAETTTGPISAGVTGPAGDTVPDPQDAHAGA
ncbi:BUB3-interacting and GLEBS motif-containing protein [Teratosphaeria destructans]|uniref:BUB3-interacting and GLEBS motif-containing protein n=1 Tax=Teratosphaeria destructans TaxID=418781 RepID=A0A9W7SXU4_9PEZI|nr:BUB3-interacting and GLEBS motif-containing protein [Teratosphaeria destructans]